MKNSQTVSAAYQRDPSLPFWRANTDADALFTAFAHRPERAQAWLKHHNMSDSNAVIMRGRFELGLLNAHTFDWTFTPTHTGDLAVVLPVCEQHRLVDLLAISKHDARVWGCVTGAGQYIGRFASPLIVHDTPDSWLLSGVGVLPLSKAFYPLMQFAADIVARDADHAWEIAHQAFIYPASRFGLDCNIAEQAALDRICFDEAAT